MKSFAVVLLLLIGNAAAFMPRTPVARSTVCMSAERTSRRSFGAGLLSGAAALGLANSAEAKAGDGAKFSFFGLVGAKDSMTENAAYGSDQSQPVYSPYSPYSPVSEKSLANSVDNSAAYKKIIAESEKRLNGKLPKYIENKLWSEILTENTRQLYELRKAMNGLAKSKEAVKAKTAFYQDLEQITLWSTRKDQALVQKNFEKAMADLAVFKTAVGI